MRRSLALVPSPSQVAAESAALISLERASLAAQLDFVREAQGEEMPASRVDVQAQLPAERLASKTAALTVLGLVAGLLVGAAVALVRAARRGTLYSPRRIVMAFDGGEVVAGVAHGFRGARAAPLWQEVRVMLDPAGPVVALLSAGQDTMTLAAGVGLAEEFASTGTTVALLDLGGRLPRHDGGEGVDGVFRVTLDSQEPAFGCRPQDAPSAVAALGERFELVIVLAPPLSGNLVTLHEIFKVAASRVILLRGGDTTQGDAARLRIAERAAPERRVLVLTN